MHLGSPIKTDIDRVEFSRCVPTDGVGFWNNHEFLHHLVYKLTRRQVEIYITIGDGFRARIFEMDI